MLTLRQLSLATFGTVLIILQADGTAQAIVAVNETDVRLLNSSIQSSIKPYCSKLLLNTSCVNNFSKGLNYSSQFTFNPLAIPLFSHVKVPRNRSFITPKSSNKSNKNVAGLKLNNSPSIKIKQSNITQTNHRKNLKNTKIKTAPSISRAVNSTNYNQNKNKETNTNSLNYSINNLSKTLSSKNEIPILKEKTKDNSSKILLSKNDLPILKEKTDEKQVVASKPSSNRTNKGYTPTSRQIGQKPPPGSGMGGTRVVNKNNSNTVDSITLNCADCGEFYTATSSSIGGILGGIDGYVSPFVPLIAGTSLTPPINTNIFSPLPPPPMLNSSLIHIKDFIFISPALREDILSISALHTDSTRDTNNISPALDFRRIPEPGSGIGTFALVILSGYLLRKRKK